jgi:hypothetical protein
MIYPLLIMGFAMMGLRHTQNQTGFDPDTGLALFSMSGILLVVGLILSAAVLAVTEWVLFRREGRRRPSLTAHFAPPGKVATPVLVAGCLLLALGGAVEFISLLSGDGNVVGAITGLLAIASCLGLLALARQLKDGEADSVGPILPALFFSVFFVLAVYLPCASDPVLPRFYLRVLASALDAYAFSLLAGFLRRETSSQLFELTAVLAVVTSIAAMADEGLANRLLFAGCACILAVFIHLQRPEDLPEPAPDAKAGETAAQ